MGRGPDLTLEDLRSRRLRSVFPETVTEEAWPPLVPATTAVATAPPTVRAETDMPERLSRPKSPAAVARSIVRLQLMSGLPVRGSWSQGSSTDRRYGTGSPPHTSSL